MGKSYKPKHRVTACERAARRILGIRREIIKTNKSFFAGDSAVHQRIADILEECIHETVRAQVFAILKRTA